MQAKHKMKPIFGKMLTADFYPEGANEEYITITITAPFDTKVLPGDVVLMDKEEYLNLVRDISK